MWPSILCLHDSWHCLCKHRNVISHAQLTKFGTSLVALVRVFHPKTQQRTFAISPYVWYSIYTCYAATKGVIIMPQYNKKNKKAASGMGNIRKVTKIKNGKEYTYYEAR